ncbi:uncharacterized protein F5Z01DRAFT_670563 [Emericellopsis atlantica]|uniref:Nudix hydrolase domain-containing protein n=1 Tax=Emericellopsis atlantica TaxID=2614577 RepID=A0A9P7ZU78_9HYPO|nr:uncharacterized protein F5Z01DRAFT_670563 [Emericellopsis atlantica]KAG9257902.1 hypothetical protein F5Z01DRAFT_670563 [Emericellopsis atlantica]
MSTDQSDTLAPIIKQWDNLSVEEYEQGWQLMVLDYPHPIGFIPCRFVDLNLYRDIWEAVFDVDEGAKTMHLQADPGPCEFERVAQANQLLDYFCSLMRYTDGFKAGLAKWLESKEREGGSTADYHPIMLPPRGPPGLKVPSPIRGILGVLTAGIHVNAYTTDDEGAVTGLWVSERLKEKTYGGKYDQIIAGGMDPEDFECPWFTFRREAAEETKFICQSDSKIVWRGAGIPGFLIPVEALGTADLTSTIYFCTKKDDEAGAAETGHIEPGIRFCFDLKLDNDVTPEPNAEDNSSNGICWLSVQQIKASLAEGMWKPNCGLVTVDFLRRHGLLDHDQDLQAAMALLRPRFDLPEPIFDTDC